MKAIRAEPGSAMNAGRAERALHQKEFGMSPQDKVDARSADPVRKAPVQDLPTREPHDPGLESPQPKVNPGRRRFMMASAAVGIGGAAAASIHDGELGGPPQTMRGSVPWVEGTADAPQGASGSGYAYFDVAEAAFVEAAVARLIPNDEIGPGAVEAGVPFFLDRQLAGRFGRGDHYFLGGPWPKGTPEQGYQGRFNPAQLYRAAIAAIDNYAREKFDGAPFSKLAAADQDAVLKGLESGDTKLDGGVDSKIFFSMLLQNTKEGYFSHPVYGGNRDMGAWKMIGFPGAHYNYKEWVQRHGQHVPFPPVGMKGRPGWTEG
jgi:gluconate 2-dehydrogenase gamma chain